jgi:hypothetical protein
MSRFISPVPQAAAVILAGPVSGHGPAHAVILFRTCPRLVHGSLEENAL